MNANLLHHLRKRNGKIERVWRYGNIVKIIGWTTFEPAFLRVRHVGQSQQILPLKTKVSGRADIQNFAPAVYEFESELSVNSSCSRILVSLKPRVMFQRGLDIEEFEACDIPLARQVFDTPTFVKFRQSLPKNDSVSNSMINNLKETKDVVESLIHDDSQTTIVLPVANDSNVVHSQLLLLDMDHLAESPIRVLIVTELPLTDKYQYHSYSSVQSARVTFLTLNSATPSQIAISIKQNMPKQNVLLVSPGYIISSLRELLSELDSLSAASSDELPLFFVPRGVYFNSPPVALRLGQGSSNLQFFVTPWHDWDFLELIRSIQKKTVLPTQCFIGKPTAAQANWSTLIQRRSWGQL